MGWVGVRRHDRSEAEPERENIFNRDCPFRGHCVVELGIEGPQHSGVGELWYPARHRVAGYGFPLDQQHSGRADDRLGERSDTEDRVSLDRLVLAKGLAPNGFDVYVVATCH